jgi:hypothetical protein
MAYEQKISQANPGLLGLILDDSGSMADNLPGTTDPKFKWVEWYFGLILHELLARCSELKGNDAIIKPRYYLTVLTYGSHPVLWGSPEMNIQEAVERFSKSGNSLGLGGHLSGTDTEAAFAEMLDHLKKSLAGERFKNAFPPLVFHLSDGESATNAAPVAEEMKRQSTADGGLLVSNAFVGTRTKLAYTGPSDFPGYLAVEEAGPNEYNIRLFEMSSQAPAALEVNLKAEGIFPMFRSGSRLFFDVRGKEMLKNVIQVVGSVPASMAR